MKSYEEVLSILGHACAEAGVVGCVMHEPTGVKTPHPDGGFIHEGRLSGIGFRGPVLEQSDNTD
jgi:hypothetical protein